MTYNVFSWTLNPTQFDPGSPSFILFSILPVILILVNKDYQNTEGCKKIETLFLYIA